jgi:hypothetical protein
MSTVIDVQSGRGRATMACVTTKKYNQTFDRTSAVWRRSTRAGGGSQSVELAILPDGGWAVRDSKDPDGAILFFTPEEVDAFVAGAKDGEFDS